MATLVSILQLVNGVASEVLTYKSYLDLFSGPDLNLVCFGVNGGDCVATTQANAPATAAAWSDGKCTIAPVTTYSNVLLALGYKQRGFESQIPTSSLLGGTLVAGSLVQLVQEIYGQYMDAQGKTEGDGSWGSW
jgi:hypothetical protein